MYISIVYSILIQSRQKLTTNNSRIVSISKNLGKNMEIYVP